MPRRYITQWQAKQALIHIKKQTLTVLEAREIIEGCFHFIQDAVPVLKERSAMGCICECPSPCRCGKETSIELLKKLYPKEIPNF